VRTGNLKIYSTTVQSLRTYQVQERLCAVNLEDCWELVGHLCGERSRGGGELPETCAALFYLPRTVPRTVLKRIKKIQKIQQETGDIHTATLQNQMPVASAILQPAAVSQV
jgi:hypothetical protein